MGSTWLISDVSSTNRLQKRLVKAATYEPDRSMSNRRLVGSIFSIFFGLSVIYASVFYAPAFLNISQILGLSTEYAKLPAIDPETDRRGSLHTYSNLFKIRRGFIRQGQALKVDYSLSRGTKMVVEIRRCEAPVFIEVIYCGQTAGQKITIKDSGPGAKSIIMYEPGFYYFDEVVLNADGSRTDKPYRVIWSRKS